MNETELLKGKTAIVTGASSGIGRATAELLGKHGVHVYLVGRTQSALEEVNNSIAQAGGTASVAQIDINERGRIAALVQQALDESQRLDIMVNNAGLEYPGSIIDGDMDKWREMVDTNILALLAGCQAGVKAMRSCGAQGHIVNVSSVSAQRPNSGVMVPPNTRLMSFHPVCATNWKTTTFASPMCCPGRRRRTLPAIFHRHSQNSSSAPRDWIFPLPPASFCPRKHMETLANNLKPMLCNPVDVANAVIYAVSQPINVNIAEIVVRPPRAMNVAH